MSKAAALWIEIVPPTNLRVSLASQLQQFASDTGASVSCISQRLLKQLPVNFQNQLQPV